MNRINHRSSRRFRTEAPFFFKPVGFSEIKIGQILSKTSDRYDRLSKFKRLYKNDPVPEVFLIDYCGHFMIGDRSQSRTKSPRFVVFSVKLKKGEPPYG